MSRSKTRGERSVESVESTESNQQQGNNRNSEMRATRKHELFATLKTIGGSVEREIKFQTELKYSPNLEFLKLNGKFHMSPLPKLTTHAYSTCFKAEILYPKAPMSAASAYEKKVHADLKVNWAPSADCSPEGSSSTNYIKATLQAERSSQQMMEETDDAEYWQCRKSQKPVACQRFLGKMGELKKYVLNLEYSELPVVLRNLTNKAWRFLKYKYFWQTDVAQIKVHNTEGKIKAIFRLDPFTNRHFNLTVKTPKENVTMYDVPLPFYVRPLNMKRSVFKQYYENSVFGRNAPICEINEELSLIHI